MSSGLYHPILKFLEEKFAENEAVRRQPLNYTTQRLVLLLENKKLNFNEIADKLHFSSPSFFSRYVRKTLDISPREYRQRLGD